MAGKKAPGWGEKGGGGSKGKARTSQERDGGVSAEN